MYTSTTLLQLRVALQARWEGVPFWTDEEARLALNEALRDWSLLTGFWKKRVVIATTQNNPWVSLPSTLTYNLRIEYDSRPLEISSIFDLDHARARWELDTSAGGDLSVPLRPMVWAPAGLTLIAIWPACGYGDHSLLIDGLRQTPVLINEYDKVDLGQVELDAILGMALHLATFKLGGQRFQASIGAYRAFLSAAADQNVRLRTSAFFRTAMGLDQGRAAQPIRASELVAALQPQEGG